VQADHGRYSHFLMTFDTSPVVLKKLDESLKRDPAVVRWVFLSPWVANILMEGDRWTLLRQGAKLYVSRSSRPSGSDADLVVV